MSSRVESVQTPDGSFDLTVWLPEAGTGPGLLLIQEIFGVSDYIRAVADDLARHGPSISDAASLLRAITVMREQRTSHLVVIDSASERPIGILSALDIAAMVGWTEA